MGSAVASEPIDGLSSARDDRVELFARLHAVETALLALASIGDPETQRTPPRIDDLGDLAAQVGTLLTSLWPTVESLRSDECRRALARSDRLAASLLDALPRHLETIAAQAQRLAERGSREAVVA
jgi:hypothetical protein